MNFNKKILLVLLKSKLILGGLGYSPVEDLWKNDPFEEKINLFKSGLSNQLYLVFRTAGICLDYPNHLLQLIENNNPESIAMFNILLNKHPEQFKELLNSFYDEQETLLTKALKDKCSNFLQFVSDHKYLFDLKKPNKLQELPENIIVKLPDSEIVIKYMQQLFGLPDIFRNSDFKEEDKIKLAKFISENLDNDLLVSKFISMIIKKEVHLTKIREILTEDLQHPEKLYELIFLFKYCNHKNLLKTLEIKKRWNLALVKSKKLKDLKLEITDLIFNTIKSGDAKLLEYIIEHFKNINTIDFDKTEIINIFINNPNKNILNLLIQKLFKNSQGFLFSCIEQSIIHKNKPIFNILLTNIEERIPTILSNNEDISRYIYDLIYYLDKDKSADAFLQELFSKMNDLFRNFKIDEFCLAEDVFIYCLESKCHMAIYFLINFKSIFISDPNDYLETSLCSRSIEAVNLILYHYPDTKLKDDFNNNWIIELINHASIKFIDFIAPSKIISKDLSDPLLKKLLNEVTTLELETPGEVIATIKLFKIFGFERCLNLLIKLDRSNKILKKIYKELNREEDLFNNDRPDYEKYKQKLIFQDSFYYRLNILKVILENDITDIPVLHEVDPMTGDTLLTHLVTNCEEKEGFNYSLLRLIIKHSRKFPLLNELVNTKNKTGETPLHLAVKKSIELGQPSRGLYTLSLMQEHIGFFITNQDGKIAIEIANESRIDSIINCVNKMMEKFNQTLREIKSNFKK